VQVVASPRCALAWLAFPVQVPPAQRPEPQELARQRPVRKQLVPQAQVQPEPA